MLKRRYLDASARHVVLYYAGHPATQLPGTLFFLCCVDSTASLYHVAIPMHVTLRASRRLRPITLNCSCHPGHRLCHPGGPLISFTSKHARLKVSCDYSEGCMSLTKLDMFHMCDLLEFSIKTATPSS
jgi:hypothetical protein